MKKILTLFAALCLCFISCARKDQPAAKTESPAENTAEPDLDLTKMSATMIYSNVFNMMLDPDSFAGKRIKCSGWFASMKGPRDEEVYSVIVPDATKCCQQGLGFMFKFEDGLPQINQNITVTGTFIIEELESGIIWSYLQAESVEF